VSAARPAEPDRATFVKWRSVRWHEVKSDPNGGNFVSPQPTPSYRRAWGPSRRFGFVLEAPSRVITLSPSSIARTRGASMAGPAAARASPCAFPCAKEGIIANLNANPVLRAGRRRRGRRRRHARAQREGKGGKGRRHFLLVFLSPDDDGDDGDQHFTSTAEMHSKRCHHLR